MGNFKLTKHQHENNKEQTLKKQLDSLRQDFLENNEIINHLFKEYKSLSSFLQATVPYHHGYLKIHITKTQILTSTLHLYVTISKHPLKPTTNIKKVTEEYHLTD